MSTFSNCLDELSLVPIALALPSFPRRVHAHYLGEGLGVGHEPPLDVGIRTRVGHWSSKLGPESGTETLLGFVETGAVRGDGYYQDIGE